MRFLSARWSHLAMLNYAVAPEVLAPYLPPHCVPDTSLDGQAYVSLVAFDFTGVRVLGIPYADFPEINLRAYVRHEPTGDRGVVFIREFVPSRLVSLIAKATYNEPYAAARMTSNVAAGTGSDSHTLRVEHRLAYRKSAAHLTVIADAVPCDVAEHDFQHWFKEHRWGFNRSHFGTLLRYEVTHARWRCHPVRSHTLELDFAGLYGPAFAPLTAREPNSRLLAEGSDITVSLWSRKTS